MLGSQETLSSVWVQVLSFFLHVHRKFFMNLLLQNPSLSCVVDFTSLNKLTERDSWVHWSAQADTHQDKFNWNQWMSELVSVAEHSQKNKTLTLNKTKLCSVFTVGYFTTGFDFAKQNHQSSKDSTRKKTNKHPEWCKQAPSPEYKFSKVSVLFTYLNFKVSCR